MENATAVPMIVRLAGVLHVTGGEGAACRIRSAKGRALIALLASANNMTRSREWLRAILWERVGERSSADSLRQELFKLRESLGTLGGHLKADSVAVWLEGAELVLEHGASAVTEFFEDAPTRLGEGFDDWLRQERLRFEDLRDAAPAPSPPPRSLPVPRIERPESLLALPDTPAPSPAPDPVQEGRTLRPCIILSPALTHCHNMRADVLAAFATEQICAAFRLNGMVDVFDLRDLERDQLSALDTGIALSPNATVGVMLTQNGDTLSISVSARHVQSRKVLWNSAISVDETSEPVFSQSQLSEFVLMAVEAIERIVCQAHAGRASENDAPSLYLAVHQLFSVSKDGLHSAKNLLRSIDTVEQDPLTAAWLAFSNVFAVGENFDARDAIAEEAEAHAMTALERDPSNPLALALVSHVFAYVLRDREQARELIDRSRQLAPTLAFGADTSAMQRIYAGDVAGAASEGATARRLGRFSPYRFWFDTTAAITATLNGDHRRALDISRPVMRARPGFLAVTRHVCANLAELGEYDAAARLFEEIRAVDPDFGTRAMLEDAYPLPATESRQAITHALSKIRRIE